MTSPMQRNPAADPLALQVQRTLQCCNFVNLDAQSALADNHIGLPFDTRRSGNGDP
ncbi:MAG: hypothetical protein M0Z91_02805 [Actinomycetota bacterium]|jgi:hypothetical protein|nr:hypothetical protein [Actinomycetota bacterium]